MVTPDDIRSTLEDFLESLHRDIGGDSHLMERVLAGNETLTTSDLGATPESWTEDTLINPLLDTVELNRVPGRPSAQRRTPDFRLEEEGADEIVGENKPPNRIEEAVEELVDDYISRKSWTDYGIATDGIEWVVYRAERGSDTTEYLEARRINLRGVLQELARENGFIGQERIGELDVESELQGFIDVFAPNNLVPLLTKEAPRIFRDQRKRDVEEFYELYIELIFGESEEYEEEYETCLRDDIVAPEENTQKQNDVFAITLVNRLLFIKFLETRDVLSDGFLRDRVEDYNEEVPGTLYKTIIEPLFYDLFNKPLDERRADHRRGWFADIPYLNGGLFRENVENEREYDVLDRTLPTLITDLIEGTELDFELDPAILGSVFEKTINHLSESENRQKEMGAYYTPNDVTRVVNEGAVDGKIRDIIIDSYTEVLSHPDEFRAETEDVDINDILSRIEDGAGWFGHDRGLRLAQERLLQLKILDPACGSGHFLTAAMEEVTQVLESIYRGLHGGNEPTPRDRYELKKQLALNAVYGVDIDPVATEIAKLRVWLKIVEGNGWREGFSQLPNIDINIVAGNSLFGLPEKSSGQASLTAFDVDIDSIQQVREQYKSEEIDRQELNDQIESLRPELQQQYLNRLNHYFEERIETSEKLERVVESLDTLYPTIRKFTVRRHDGGEFSEEEKESLNVSGWRVEPRVGKSAKVEDEEVDDLNLEVYSALLEDGHIFDVERRPTLFDLHEIEGGDELSSGPFHWIVEFPEAVVQGDNGNGYTVEFDIVVGNPPYGDVLTKSEKRFVRGYRTGSINDIAMPFIERELQLLSKDGYFGNIHSMGVLYQGSAAPARDILRENLANGRTACFGHRPATVFEGANPRAAITTGRKTTEEDDRQNYETSEFILFYPEGREAAFRDIEYGSIEGLVLGNRIGDEDSNKSYPKVGSEMSRAILENLRDNSDRIFESAIERRDPDSTDHVVYRSYHPLYWMNPFLENLYEDHGTNQPRDFEPMYFETEIERNAAFLILQSSMFYHYWMTYENQRDLNWGPIEAFPFPTVEDLRPLEDEINEIADEMWVNMSRQFNGREISEGYRLKPIADRADDLLDPLLGLDEQQIGWLKNYHTEFGRSQGSEGTRDVSLGEIQGE